MVIADTGFWVALANKKDAYHARASEFLGQAGLHLITTWPVMTETCHLLLQRLGTASLLAFMEGYSQRAFDVFNLQEGHSDQIVRLMTKYRDLPMDLADASLVILAEHLGTGLILSTDARDFQAYRWKNRQPFQNLLLPEG